MYVLLTVGIIDPSIARLPTNVIFSVGVEVPTPNLPFTLSQKNAELFCERRPLFPMNGIDPGVNGVYKLFDTEKFVDDPFMKELDNETKLPAIKLSA